MRLTLRGRVVASGIVVVAIWGYLFGIPAVNAIVLPGIIALLGGWVLVRRVEPPKVERFPVDPGRPHRRRRVELAVSHPEAMSVRLEDSLPPDVRATDGKTIRPVVGERVSYEIVARERGAATIGPVIVRIGDPVGLFTQVFTITATAELITYPRVRSLNWQAANAVFLSDGAPTSERHRFDSLREYSAGDPLRDIHWRSSAKRPHHEFIVKEFVADTEAGGIHIAGACVPRRADEMASAVASIAMWLLDAGIPVGVETKDTSIPVDAGPDHRRAILLALARTDGGPLVPEVANSAPITVEASGRGPATIRTANHSTTFEACTSRGTQRPEVRA